MPTGVVDLGTNEGVVEAWTFFISVDWNRIHEVSLNAIRNRVLKVLTYRKGWIFLDIDSDGMDVRRSEMSRQVKPIINMRPGGL